MNNVLYSVHNDVELIGRNEGEMQFKIVAIR